MSTCGRCQSPIVWVPKPGQAGGYFRPLEKVDIEGAATLYVVSGANLLQVQDSLLQWHVCAEDRPPMPKIVVDDPDELDELAPGPERPLTDFEEHELELERRDRERDAAIQAKIDADLARYAKAKANKVHAPYDRIACPRCHVPAGDPCRSLGSPGRSRPHGRTRRAGPSTTAVRTTTRAFPSDRTRSRTAQARTRWPHYCGRSTPQSQPARSVRGCSTTQHC